MPTERCTQREHCHFGGIPGRKPQLNLIIRIENHGSQDKGRSCKLAVVGNTVVVVKDKDNRRASSRLRKSKVRQELNKVRDVDRIKDGKIRNLLSMALPGPLGTFEQCLLLT